MNPSPLNISVDDFTYQLPEEKIALFPLPNRDASKLLVYSNGKIKKSAFASVGEFLPPGTHLVFNNTRVIRARLHFRNKKQQNIEVFCLEPVDNTQMHNAGGKAEWYCLVGRLKHWNNEELEIKNEKFSLRTKLIEKKGDKQKVEFTWEPQDKNFYEILELAGEIPIPPYIKRKTSELDNTRYQTVYSKINGSVAAPTAGLHFTDELLDRLHKNGVKTHQVTLHVGAGTFKPVKSGTLAGHEMHSESLEITIEAIEALVQCKGHLVAVGTTSLRCLETIYWLGCKAITGTLPKNGTVVLGQWEAYELQGKLPERKESFGALLAWMRENEMPRFSASTGILIAPPYKIRTCDALITNFHQPQSTLLLLVAAFIGEDWRKVYEYALTNDFRFLSYGDSSLLFVNKSL